MKGLGGSAMYTSRGVGHNYLPEEWEPILAQALQLPLYTNCGSLILPFDETPFPWLYRDFVRPRCEVVGLWPSQQIVSHQDAPITGKRYHLPLQTNPGCWSFHDGDWQQLHEGRIYQMDPTKSHGAVNWGSEIRLHLIIDTTS